MEKCERVIVTLRIQHAAYDLELPAFLPVSELKRRILETLLYVDPGRYSGIRGLELYFHGKPLPGNRHLASCGVWDGSVLDGRLI